MMTRIVLAGVGMLGFALLAGAAGFDPAGDASTQLQAQRGELPMHLRWVLDNPNRRPPPGIRREARVADKIWLMREYRRQPTVYQRLASAWLLAYIGDDEVFRLFSEDLRLGPTNQPVSMNDSYVLGEQLVAMGVMAQTNDLAFEFLRRAISPEWWRTERKWKEDPRLSNMNARLTGSAGIALGVSGRPGGGGNF